MTADTFTPNLHLTKIAGDARNWAERMNGNLTLMDAVIGAFFTVQNLQGIWENSTAYAAEQTVVDNSTSVVWQCQVAHTSASIPTTFMEDRAANPTYWSVYSTPARARGAWTPSTNYALNDFVVSGAQYAICIQAHTSGAIFATDLVAGKWSVLVDLSTAGSQVLPVPGGVPDANKFVVTTAGGSGYTIVSATAALDLLGFQTVGRALAVASSQVDARSAIGAQASGSYQTLNSNLTTLSSATLQPFGIALLGIADASGLRSAAELGSVAQLNSTDVLLVTNNLSDLNNSGTARSNIGLAYASVAEQETGTAVNRVVAPGTQLRHPSAAKAWASFDAAGVISASYGITSVVRNSAGNLTVTLSTAMSSVNYVAPVAGDGGGGGIFTGSTIVSTTVITVVAYNTVTQTAQDSNRYYLVVYGDQ